MEIFGTALAVIEFNFLEQVQFVKDWSNHLFELFEWLDEMEEEFSLHDQLYVFLLNEDHLFFKERKQAKIGVYQNPFVLRPEADNQLIVICSKKIFSASYKNSVEMFIDNLLGFLEDRGIKNQVLPEQYISQLTDFLTINQLIEVLIGISH